MNFLTFLFVNNASNVTTGVIQGNLTAR